MIEPKLIVSPLKVPVSTNKFFILSLNNYRNTHHRVLAVSKVAYRNIMKEEILKLPSMDKGCSLVFIAYPKTKRLSDLDNICSVVCKYFQDAMVYYNRIPDDNTKYIKNIQYEFGEVDKYFPRVEVIVVPN